ncbi:MAG: hypothetical protein ABI091_23665 [Ferruginibacter sp.]
MALRDQPYLPLYIQDFLTDEKLNECSASATGVYIKIMCLMHKSQDYGQILLKQKDKQTPKQTNEPKILFANKLAKLLPFDIQTILSGLTELLDENVLKIDGDFLIQKRMFEDGLLSLKRSESGSYGAEVKKEKGRNFAIPKPQANTEYEYDNENIDRKEGGMGEGKEDWRTMPGPEKYDLALPEIKSGAACEMYYFTNKVRLTKDQIETIWIVFKNQNFTGEKFYSSPQDTYSHFINWIKTQKINGTDSIGTSKNSKQSAAVERLLKPFNGNFEIK